MVSNSENFMVHIVIAVLGGKKHYAVFLVYKRSLFLSLKVGYFFLPTSLSF
jgi:hypothetical protein